MNDFIEFPTSYPDAVALLCENLTLTDIKSLSLVNEEWFNATFGILSDISIFHPTDPEYLKRFQRNFKNFTVSNGTTDDINNFLDNLISVLRRKRRIEEECQTKYKRYQIESLRFENVALNASNISKLSQLETVTELEFIWCTFMVHGSLEESLSSLSLKTVKVDLDQEIDLSYVSKILQDNKNSISTFHFTTSKLLADDNFLENCHFPNLEEFFCKSTVYTWNFHGIGAFFEKHPGIKRCYLNGSFLNDVTITAIKQHCLLIEELGLERATSFQLTHIPEMKSLRSLSVVGSEINQTCLLNLKSLKLEKLSVHILKNGRIKMKKLDFVNLLVGLPSLAEINFSNSDNFMNGIATGILPLISNCCPVIARINLSGNQLIKNDEDTVKKFENLKFLNLYNTGLKDETLDKLDCPKLQEVNLGETNIKPEAFKNFITRSPFLKVLKFRGSKWLTDNEVLFLAKRLECLRSLEMQDCSKLTFKSLEYLVKEQFISHITISISSTKELESVTILKKGFYEKMNHFNTHLLSNGYRNIWIFVNDNSGYQWIKVNFPNDHIN